MSILLHHFSSDPAIVRFDPRPVQVPTKRPPGREWLNGALVWAIEPKWRGTYLYPRECPRIVLRRTAATTLADEAKWFGDSRADMIAYVETRWLDDITNGVLYRYDLQSPDFVDIHDHGVWASRKPVVPLACTTLTDLPAELAQAGVELRPVDSLVFLRNVWDTTLHASGIRLRNATGWDV